MTWTAMGVGPGHPEQHQGRGDTITVQQLDESRGPQAESLTRTEFKNITRGAETQRRSKHIRG